MFKCVKEIKSRNGILHFRRYRVVETPFFNVYLHRIFKSGEDIDVHGHPWWFFTWILWGGYCEKFVRNQKAAPTYRLRMFPFIYFTGLKSFHKILATRRDKPVTTLVFTGPRHKMWRYLVPTPQGNLLLTNEEYRERKHNGKSE